MTVHCPVNSCKSRREPLADYLSNRDFVSSSQLRRFDQSGRIAAQQPGAGVAPGTVMGEALHALVLEPEAFSRQYLVLANAASDQHTRSEQDLMQREWLDAWQWTALSGARNALMACSQAPVSQWLSDGRKELSIYWRDATGAAWKARPDCFTGERFGYDLQAAHYIDAVARLTGNTPRFAFLAVELNAPHAVWVHELGSNEINAASARLGDLKRAYLDAGRCVDDTLVSPQ